MFSGSSEQPPGAIAVAEAMERFVRQRVDGGLRVLLAVVVLFGGFDFLRLPKPVFVVHILQILAAIATIVALRSLPRLTSIESVRRLGIGAIAGASLVSAINGVVLGDPATTALLAIGILMGSATLIGWRGRDQALAAAAVFSAVCLNVSLVHQNLGALITAPMLALVIVSAFSIWVATVLGRELHARTEAEVSRAESERRFLDLVERTSIIPWEANVAAARLTYIGPQAERVMGFSQQEWLAPGFWQTRIHPEDRERVFAVGPRRRELPASHVLEYRVLAKDGRVVWVQDRISTSENQSGPYLRGFLLDVTEQREAEQHREHLLRASERFSEVVGVQDIFDRVVDAAYTSLRCGTALVVHWDESGGQIRLASQRGVNELSVPIGSTFPFHANSVLGPRNQGAVTTHIESVEDVPPSLREILEAQGVTSLLATPLADGHGEQARLAVLRYDGQRFAEIDIKLLEALSRLAGLALERARFFAQIQDSAAVSEHLSELSRRLLVAASSGSVYDELARSACEILGAASTQIWLRESDGFYVPRSHFGRWRSTWKSIAGTRLPEATEHVSRLVRERVVTAQTGNLAELPQREHLDSTGITRMVDIVLERGGTVFGVLSCFWTEPLDWSPRRKRLAEGISSVGSIAAEHASLLDALASANRAKSDFVSAMSHELRTPLNVIIGYNELLREGELGPVNNEQREALTRVLVQSESLLELINQTLEFGRLDTGSVRLELTDGTINELIESVVSASRELQTKPAVKVRWQGDARPILVRADFGKLRMVVRNLLHNALKFTDQGEIEILGSVRNDRIEVSVRDTGIGIPPEAQARIFEPFRQVDDSSTSRFGGVGLGLYIARQHAQSMGGDLSVESEVGRGSTFRLSVPIGSR